MYTVIEAPLKRVKEVLHVVQAKARKHDLFVGPASIPVGVLQIENVRCHAHEYTAIVASDGRRPSQAAGEQSTRVKDAVRVRVRQ